MSVSLDDDAVSSEHAHLVRRGNRYYLVDASSKNGSYVNADRVTRPRLLHEGDQLQFGSTILKFSMIDDLEEQTPSLFELAARDAVTHAFNHRYLNAHLHGEFAFAARQHAPLAILLIDIDHFKRINDMYGHCVGDVVMRLVASRMQQVLRPYDVLCRYDSDEFLVLARDTSARNAEILAQRIRRKIEGLCFKTGSVSAVLTVSIGVTAVVPAEGADIEALLPSVRAALREAKQAGRNQVRLSSTFLPRSGAPRRAQATTADPLASSPAAETTPGASMAVAERTREQVCRGVVALGQ